MPERQKGNAAKTLTLFVRSLGRRHPIPKCLRGCDEVQVQQGKDKVGKRRKATSELLASKTIRQCHSLSSRRVGGRTDRTVKYSTRPRPGQCERRHRSERGLLPRTAYVLKPFIHSEPSGVGWVDRRRQNMRESLLRTAYPD